jgi:dCMP deaminase
MAIAFLSSQRSKDPKKQVGACIVNSDRVIVGIGYNGFPRCVAALALRTRRSSCRLDMCALHAACSGCADDALPWAKSSAAGDVLETKTPYVVHAEANAILNKNAITLHGAHLYVTMYPCCECAKLIIQCGIREVTYYEAKKTAPGALDPLYVAAAKMLSLAGVRVQQHRAQMPLVLNLFAKAGPGDAAPVTVLSSP